MRADNSGHVIDAARRRSQATQQRAVAALRRMDNAGVAVNFESVAKEAAVSRSWLYTHTELRREIERLRGRQNSTASALIPERQKISDASLVRRLEAANERIGELQSDNRRLRDALAEALGANRRRHRWPHRPKARLHRKYFWRPLTILRQCVEDTVQIANLHVRDVDIAATQDNTRAPQQRDQAPQPGSSRSSPTKQRPSDSAVPSSSTSTMSGHQPNAATSPKPRWPSSTGVVDNDDAPVEELTPSD